MTVNSRPPTQGIPPPRLARMDQRPLPGGGRLFVARGFRQRLLGLAGLAAMPPDCALLIDECDSVHTAWMRFAIDVVFLDSGGEPLRVVSGLPPWRVARWRGARAVVETRADAAPDWATARGGPATARRWSRWGSPA